MEKMTKREFLQAVAEGRVDAEIKVFAEQELEKLDATNERKRAANAKKNEENRPILDGLMAVATAELQTTSEFAAAVEISPQKASALLRKLVEEGMLKVEEVKVPKKGVQKAYATC